MWMFGNVYECMWIYLNVYECMWMYVNVCEYMYVCMCHPLEYTIRPQIL